MLYNLTWFIKPLLKKPAPAPVARHNKSTISTQRSIEAVILYPALATPEIIASDNDNLEVLLLTKVSYTIPVMRSFIRSQLKVCTGLNAARHCSSKALFVDSLGNDVGSVADRTIDVQSIPFSADAKLATKSGRFAGYIDKRAYAVYKNAEYTHLYSISMSNKCLAPAAASPQFASAGEPQDILINGVLDRHHPELKQGSKYYAFALGSHDVDFTKYDTKRPIQAWHPVYHFAANDLQYANISHLSDVHLAARQQVLAKSHARVIDYASKHAEADQHVSPYIGHRINICSKDMWNIMGQFANSSADLFMIGGDLVDFIRSCHLSATVAPKVQGGKPSDVWDAVGVGDNYTDTYKDCVDFMAFYGMLLQYCSANAKPAFLISGNHDCYWLPYGLSPRIGGSLIDHRANEGIPSDHNLTFYEAILAFGETFRELKSGLSSPFSKDKFDWFYTVFTPFTDFSVELPKQMLVACGWGDQEDLFDSPGTGHGFGHLPRSKDGMSAHQMALLNPALTKGKKVILMTHFTFVSYTDSIPISKGETHLGDVYFDIFKNFEDHNLGTFELNRKPMFETHCGNSRDIQVILTGHSHRRALYLVDRVDYSGRNSVKTLHFDFDKFAHAKAKYPGKLEPAIIVSDSGGTIPRYNWDGEFNGRGSDPPSGTAIVFDQGTGAVDSVVAVRAATCHPRLAVALDYLDIQEKEDVILQFQSKEFNISDEKAGNLTDLTFDITLSDHLNKRGIAVAAVSLYSKSSTFDWMKVELAQCGTNSFAAYGNWNVQTFINFMAKNQERGNFMAMKFSRTVGFRRYNFDDSWCFEFQVDFKTSGRSILHWSPSRKKYILLRDKKRAEIPDFDWRRKCIPQKYA
jgi:3',5'-cyclic AMP phosphodiesterase CpdA